jgi:hypothetical protein
MDCELSQKCDGIRGQISECFEALGIAISDKKSVCRVYNVGGIGIDGATGQEQIVRDLEVSRGGPIGSIYPPIEINLGVMDEAGVAIDLMSNDRRKREERRRPSTTEEVDSMMRIRGPRAASRRFSEYQEVAVYRGRILASARLKVGSAVVGH